MSRKTAAESWASGLIGGAVPGPHVLAACTEIRSRRAKRLDRSLIELGRRLVATSRGLVDRARTLVEKLVAALIRNLARQPQHNCSRLSTYAKSDNRSAQPRVDRRRRLLFKLQIPRCADPQLPRHSVTCSSITASLGPSTPGSRPSTFVAFTISNAMANHRCSLLRHGVLNFGLLTSCKKQYPFSRLQRDCYVT